MASRIEQYRACAAVCCVTEYASKRGVRQHNAAAKQMRAMVSEAYATGPSALAEFFPLLDESPADQWLAFQLLELAKPEAAVKQRCLSIIKRLAAGPGIDAMGAGIRKNDMLIS